MKHTYTVKGMTCNGCRTGVEKYLSEVAGVINVAVSLEDEEAVIEMNSHIATETFQEALPEKYTFSKKEEVNIFASSVDVDNAPEMNSGQVFAKAEQEQSKLQQLKPLFLILFYIIAATVLLNYKTANWQSGMLDFMGLFYIVFSFFKMLDLNGFASSFQMYDPLAKKVFFYAKIYPFIETVLGLLFLMRFQIEIALVTTIVILGITTVGVTVTLLNKKAIQCACLGTALKLPMTEATFIENAIMITMAVVMLSGLML